MNKQLIEDSKAFISLPIDQSVGFFNADNPNAPCCVGARLAQFMQVKNGHYHEGVDAFAKALGGNRAHLILMLSQAGAGKFPFYQKEWDVAPTEVWENLSKFEKLPNLSGADLSGADLSEADLSEADLSEAKLGGAKLSCANLSEANLSGANLNEADLSGANLLQAKLSEAKLG